MMMAADILDQIVTQKLQEVTAARQLRPEASLREAITPVQEKRSFYDRLSIRHPRRVNIIAEIKRASPSKGPIRPDLDPAWYAREYERGGAAALSVLTDRHFFKGSPQDLKTARRETSLPVLRKDFIVSAYQIFETAVIGADAVLLIAAILAEPQLKDYLALCRELNLDALVEIHAENEYQQATRAGASLIGINNRNLKTFHTDISTSITLAPMLAVNQVAVAESGIRSPADIDAVRRAGIGNFLIGESLMRAESPRRLLQSLISCHQSDKPENRTSRKISDGTR
jgi:indole-3-glycerol phosphate synthase